MSENKAVIVGGKALLVGGKAAGDCACACLPVGCSLCVNFDPDNPDQLQTIQVTFSGVTTTGPALGTYTLTNSKDDRCHFTYRESIADGDAVNLSVVAFRSAAPAYWSVGGSVGDETGGTSFGGISWAEACCTPDAPIPNESVTIGGTATVAAGEECPTCEGCCPDSDANGYYLLVTFDPAPYTDDKGTIRLFEMGESCTWWGYDIGGRLQVQGTAADLKLNATDTSPAYEWTANATGEGCPPRNGWAPLAINGVGAQVQVTCGRKHAPTDCSRCCGMYTITFPFTETVAGVPRLVERDLTLDGECRWTSAQWETVFGTFTYHTRAVMRCMEGDVGYSGGFRPVAAKWLIKIIYWLPGTTEPEDSDLDVGWTAWASGDDPSCPPTDPAAWAYNLNSGDFHAPIQFIDVSNCAGECPTDCTSCCSSLILKIDYGAGPQTFTLDQSGCEWHRTSVVDGYDIDLTCTDGLWTLLVDSTLAGPCQTTWTAPVDGTCPPTDAAAWTLQDNTCDGTPVLVSLGCVCPETCTDCPNSLIVTISGGTSVDGSYTFTKESECVWSKSGGGITAAGLACLDGRWQLQVFGLDFCELDMIAGNDNTACPVGLDGWTMKTNGCGGSPHVTVEAA